MFSEHLGFYRTVAGRKLNHNQSNETTIEILGQNSNCYVR